MPSIFRQQLIGFSGLTRPIRSLASPLPKTGETGISELEAQDEPIRLRLTITAVKTKESEVPASPDSSADRIVYSPQIFSMPPDKLIVPSLKGYDELLKNHPYVLLFSQPGYQTIKLLNKLGMHIDVNACCDVTAIAE